VYSWRLDNTFEGAHLTWLVIAQMICFRFMQILHQIQHILYFVDPVTFKHDIPIINNSIIYYTLP